MVSQTVTGGVRDLHQRRAEELSRLRGPTWIGAFFSRRKRLEREMIKAARREVVNYYDRRVNEVIQDQINSHAFPEIPIDVYGMSVDELINLERQLLSQVRAKIETDMAILRSPGVVRRGLFFWAGAISRKNVSITIATGLCEGPTIFRSTVTKRGYKEIMRTLRRLEREYERVIKDVFSELIRAANTADPQQRRQAIARLKEKYESMTRRGRLGAAAKTLNEARQAVAHILDPDEDARTAAGLLGPGGPYPQALREVAAEIRYTHLGLSQMIDDIKVRLDRVANMNLGATTRADALVLQDLRIHIANLIHTLGWDTHASATTEPLRNLFVALGQLYDPDPMTAAHAQAELLAAAQPNSSVRTKLDEIQQRLVADVLQPPAGISYDDVVSIRSMMDALRTYGAITLDQNQLQLIGRLGNTRQIPLDPISREEADSLIAYLQTYLDSINYVVDPRTGRRSIEAQSEQNIINMLESLANDPNNVRILQNFGLSTETINMIRGARHDIYLAYLAGVIETSLYQQLQTAQQAAQQQPPQTVNIVLTPTEFSQLQQIAAAFPPPQGFDANVYNPATNQNMTEAQANELLQYLAGIRNEMGRIHEVAEAFVRDVHELENRLVRHNTGHGVVLDNRDEWVLRMVENIAGPLPQNGLAGPIIRPLVDISVQAVGLDGLRADIFYNYISAFMNNQNIETALQELRGVGSRSQQVIGDLHSLAQIINNLQQRFETQQQDQVAQVQLTAQEFQTLQALTGRYAPPQGFDANAYDPQGAGANLGQQEIQALAAYYSHISRSGDRILTPSLVAAVNGLQAFQAYLAS